MSEGVNNQVCPKNRSLTRRPEEDGPPVCGLKNPITTESDEEVQGFVWSKTTAPALWFNPPILKSNNESPLTSSMYVFFFAWEESADGSRS